MSDEERPHRATAEGPVPFTDEEMAQLAIDQAAAAIVPVPRAVTMRQARLALLGAGKLADVDTAITAMAEPQRTMARIEWEYSNEVLRNGPLVTALGGALSLSGAQIDALFVQAAAL